VIIPPTGIRVLVATKPVDFRKGMDGLAAYVQEAFKADPFSGVIYVFRAKRADRVKLMFWDQTGLVLVSKRLEDGRFRWPARGSLRRCGPCDTARVHAGPVQPFDAQIELALEDVETQHGALRKARHEGPV